mmetsp:Transcript_14969/g.18149  ORF Transcript_14969/g.18149 Transcript_14969/m.18149 type:complete len:91 (-) Transcript_14969:175-447(-)
MFQKKGVPFARANNAANTPYTKSHNTKLVKLRILHKVKDVTIESSKDMEDKPNQFFTRKQRPQRKLLSVLNARNAKPSSRLHLNGVSILS